MKLELSTNATVVDDAISFVALHAVSIEKGNSDKMAVDDEVLSHDDVFDAFRISLQLFYH